MMIGRIALAGVAAAALTIAPALIEGHYLNRWGTPADVAQAVGLLVSGALPFSTGEVINVDGGFHLRNFPA